MNYFCKAISLLLCATMLSVLLVGCSRQPLTVGEQALDRDITTLTLSEEVTDISVLKACGKLEYLDISKCPIDDISPLKRCDKLNTLLIGYGTYEKNKSVFNSLSSLKILTIRLSDEDFPIDTIDVSNIEYFELYNASSQPLDLSLLEIENVATLKIHSSNATSLENLSEFDGLKKLIAYIKEEFCGIKLPSSLTHLEINKYDLCGVEDMSQLETLIVKYALVDNLNALASLRSIEVLRIGKLKTADNYINALSFLEQLLILKDIYLPLGKEISDLSAFAHLEKLETLCCDGIADIDSAYSISDISAVAALKNLKLFSANGPFDDISALASLPQLEALFLCGKFSDISTLAELDKLQTLQLISAQLSDISPLLRPTELTLLIIYKSDIPQEQFDKFQEYNPDCYLGISEGGQG